MVAASAFTLFDPRRGDKPIALAVQAAALAPPTLPMNLRRLRGRMLQYDFFCHACQKIFSKILTIAEHGKEKIKCPHCGSNKVEQRWAEFYAVTSKKSA